MEYAQISACRMGVNRNDLIQHFSFVRYRLRERLHIRRCKERKEEKDIYIYICIYERAERENTAIRAGTTCFKNFF